MSLGDRFKRIFGHGKKEDDEIFQENGIVEFESSANEIVEKDLEDVRENDPYEFDFSPNGNVLFVCSANTDRSPIAEAVFNQKSADKKAFSAGMSTQNDNPASDNAIMVCANHGIDLSRHRTRNIGIVPIYNMNLVLAATANVRDALKIIYPNLEVFTIKEYAGGYSDLDISDPFGGDMSSYEECFHEIEEAISRILEADGEIIDRPAETTDEIIDRPSQIRSFGYLDDLVHSGSHEIVLDSDIILNHDEELEYPNGIQLDLDDILIDGNGHTVDACGKAQIFYCTGKNVRITNITLKGGFTTGEGGAIYNKQGELHISKSHFVNNVAEYNGGAIGSWGLLSVDESEFINNETGRKAGAIYIDAATVSHRINNIIIKNSKFECNSAAGDGGALYNEKDELTITDSTFKGNASKSSAGAIYNKSGDVKVNGGTFDSNTADEECSHDISNDNTLTLKNVCFTNPNESVLNNKKCYATDEIEDNVCNQGKIFTALGDDERGFSYLIALIQENPSQVMLDRDIKIDWYNGEDKTYSEGMILDMDNIVIDGRGHTVDAQEMTRIFKCLNQSIVIKNIILKNGSPESDGGAIYNLGSLTVKDSTITDNSVLKYTGAAIYNDGEELNIYGCDISNNSAGFGGAILNRRGYLNIDSSKFSGNHAYHEGGAIDNAGGKLTISDSVFCSNSSSSGGCIFNKSFMQLSIIGSRLVDNKASPIGSAIFNEGGDISIVDSTVSKNTSNNYGAVVNEGGDLVVDESIFSENVTYGEGGAISNKGQRLIIYNSILKNNYAKNGGGAIYNRGGNFKINNSTLEENQSDEGRGGALHHNSDNGFLMQSCTLFNNSAKSGGAAYVRGKDLRMEDSTFTHNHADIGTIKLESGDSLSLNKDHLGGAICTDSALYISTLAVLNCRMCHNTADEGGAIYSSSNLFMEDSTLSNNKSSDKGGALMNSEHTMTISKSTITDNSSRYSGAIFNNGIKMTISDSTIANNKSDYAIIRTNHGDFRIFSSEISNNDSPESIISNGDFLQFYDVIFEGNCSKQMVFNDRDRSNISFFNGKFINNSLRECVINNNSGYCTVEKTVFEDNISSAHLKTIINKGEFTLAMPKMNDGEKTVMNDGYMFIKGLGSDFKSNISGEGEVEFRDSIHFKEFDFEYLDKKIHNGDSKEIVLDEDIHLENYEREFYEGGIELDIDGLIIDGKCRIIDAAGKSRIFIISGKNITLKNIIFKNGRSFRNFDNISNPNGGVLKILNNVDVTIENCKFLDSTSDTYAGAIFNRRGEICIKKSLFANNNASYRGGAIHNGGIANITGSVFKDNHVPGNYGGAIHNVGEEMTIIGSSFSNNTAPFFGGAILAGNTKLTIIDSEFTNNSVVNQSGGAIHIQKSDLIIENSTFADNSSKYHGGAIYCDDCIVTVEGSSFCRNTVTRSGGAIFTKYVKYEENNCIFKDNTPNDKSDD